MARKESDMVKNDAWQVDGLVSPTHMMADWASKRVKGILTAELTEGVRQRVATMLGLDLSKTDDRKAIKAYLENEANNATVDAIRGELRSEAQDAFTNGTYGAGTRGPLADPPRVTALMPLIVELNAAKGRNFDPQSVSRNDRIDMVSKFEAAYGGPRGKYHTKIAELTAGLAATKSAELVNDL